LCCYRHLDQFFNRATDDLLKLAVDDGPLKIVGDSFDSFFLRQFLAAIDEDLLIPYRCVLQNLFEMKDDLLELDLNEMNTRIHETFAQRKSKSEEVRATLRA
jgi:hypothetical protein